ncbi:MAG TPA: adenosine deaminase [Gemmatimonadaceae bacterium]|nr:adenosine deaminase [Gemmatimonadaceae bacterium]
MTLITRELLRALPKAELHCHLDGSVRAETMLELAREYGQPMPVDDPDALREHMVVKNAHNLEEYLERFTITLSVMQRADAIERIAYELAEDAARDGVRYLEVRYAPVLNTREGLSLDEVVEAAARGLARAERDHDITARIIICGLRHLDPEVSITLAKLAVAHRQRGVVGFDLAGGERGHPARTHADAFAYARQHELAVTVHAGEGDGAESVRQAVHVCGADRLGHATRLIDDESLTRYVNDRRIALEVCLTSNVQTHASESLDAHPVRRYFDRGMNVVLNTDNRLMSGTTLTDEYLLAARHHGFTFEELSVIALNGFASAFLPWEDRLRLLERARREIQRLRGLSSATATA